MCTHTLQFTYIYEHKNQIKTWPSHMIGLFRIPFGEKKQFKCFKVAHTMRPIVWTRSSCVIGEKVAVAAARENDYYIVCCSVRAEAKKNTLAHTLQPLCTAAAP